MNANSARGTRALARQAQHDTANALLVVAHPGHELRLHGWLVQSRPDVIILTDGSGRRGSPRTQLSRALLHDVGAAPATLFGKYTDQQMYSALLCRNRAFVRGIASALVAAIESGRYSMVVADPLEGYNPTHDLCRVLVDAALRRVSGARSGLIASYDYELMQQHWPVSVRGEDVDGKGIDGQDIELVLEQPSLSRKLAAAAGYALLADEVNTAISREGVARQRHEILHRLRMGAPHEELTAIPYYEEYGDRQRAAGHYASVIRYREHFLPMAEMLSRWADLRAL